MKRKIVIPSLCLLIASCTTTKNNKETTTVQRPSVKCMENSPERRGEEGCSILSDRPIAGSLTNNVYWHIDRFDSMETAMRHVGPNSVATEAHGYVWLLTVESGTEDHHIGQHIARLGPFAPPASERYTMRVQSSLLMPGSTTPIHTHSGPEIFYLVDGEQCIEMTETGHHLRSGQSFIVPGNSVHRGRVIGSKPRRAIVLVLYDAARPGSTDLNSNTPIASCK